MAFSLPDIRPLRLVCVLVLVAIAAWHLRMSLLLQSEFSDRKVADPEIAYERNPRMLTWHGKERHLIEADTAGAERLFRQALAVNPVFIPAWLGLAELKNDTGDRKAADALLDLVDRTTEGVNRYRWDKVLVAHQMGRRDILERDLAWLAADDGSETPVGLINCFAGFSTFAARPLLNIHDVVVHADYRGRGIGRGLLAWAEQRARDLGCCKLTLEVLSNNTAAQAAYERAGFAPYVLDPAAGQALFLQKLLPEAS